MYYLHFGLEWASSALIELNQPLTPGQFGRSHSQLNEVISRAINGLAALFLLPLGLSGRLVSSLFKPNFTHLQGIEATPFEGAFKCTTLNVCCLEGGLPKLFGGVDPWWVNKRIKALANIILNQRADIVTLQEMHSPLAAFKLYKKLKNDYAHFYLDIGPHKWSLFNSGLFIASKFEIKDPHFTPFRVAGQTSSINKGFFSFKLDECMVIATHLEPGRGENKAAIRQAQLEAIEAAQKGQCRAFIVGDFNTEVETPEFEAIPESLGQKIYQTQVTSTDFFQALRRGEEPLPEGEGHVVDFALAKNLTLTCQLVETFDYGYPHNSFIAPPTDHRGLTFDVLF